MNKVAINPNDDQLVSIIEIYKKLDAVGKAKMLVEIDRISRENNKAKP